MTFLARASDGLMLVATMDNSYELEGMHSPFVTALLLCLGPYFVLSQTIESMVLYSSFRACFM